MFRQFPQVVPEVGTGEQEERRTNTNAQVGKDVSVPDEVGPPLADAEDATGIEPDLEDYHFEH